MSKSMPVPIPITAAVSLEGFYTLTVRKVSDDSIARSVGPFKNVITDIGLERLGSGGPISFAYVGTGTAAGATTDTQMGAYLRNSSAVQSNVQTNAGASPYWVQRSITYRFSPAGVNQNITEVGVGWISNSVAGLWSRARTVDGSNNPVTVTVLADEYLDVTYTLRFYPQITDSSYSVSINSVSYSFTSRSANINSAAIVLGADMRATFSGLQAYGGPATLGPLTGSITGFVGSATMHAGTIQAYVPASQTASTISLSTISQGNVSGGITAMLANPSGFIFAGCPTQIVVSPAIPKDATKSLSLTFSWTWDRV